MFPIEASNHTGFSDFHLLKLYRTLEKTQLYVLSVLCLPFLTYVFI
jgi:hypothetical protein